MKENALAETAIRKRRLCYKEWGHPDKTRFPPLVQNSHTAEKNLSDWCFGGGALRAEFGPLSGCIGKFS